MSEETKTQTTATEASKPEGIRATISKEAFAWLVATEEATGLSRSELIEEALAALRQVGKKKLAEAIIANAQAKANKLLSS